MKGLRKAALYRDGTPILGLWIADHWWSRARGLLGRPRLGRDEALLISPCNSVHGLGMTYPLDLLFLDRQGRLLRATRLAPLGMRWCRGGWGTIECAPGTIEHYQLKAGQVLTWEGHS